MGDGMADGDATAQAVRHVLERTREPRGGQDLVTAGLVESVRVQDGLVQVALLADPQRARYAELLLRTLRGGSCGALPLPPRLRGKAAPLELDLPQ